MEVHAPGPLDRPIACDRDPVRATLVGLPRVELGECVYPHEIDADEADATRTIALFDVENTGREILRWQTGQTTFVGTDDYTYTTSRRSLDPAQFGPGCHTRYVDIQPGKRARVVTLVEELPAGVEVAEVVHRLPANGSMASQRLVFAVA